MTQRDCYQSGGSLPLDSPHYVARQADHELYQALLAGTYCYVLNSRQMGKSSLRVRTVKRLLDAGIRCAEIELLGIGSQHVTAPQWYGGMIQLLNSRLGLKVNRRQWIRDHEDLSPVQRLGTFIGEVVLPQVNQSLVIFFDEIDSVLGLKFPTEDFFGLIRSFYEQRASHPLYRHLTVVMLGVATPSDLMRDRTSTPFNIGKAIPLNGFTLDEAQPLRPGLASVFTDTQAGLAAILEWTGGQPFLTQKLCQLVVSNGPALDGTPQQIVDQVARTHILNHWDVQDEPEHLRTIRNRLLLATEAPARLLRLYQRILKQDGITFDNRSPDQMALRFAGLVTQHQGKLRVFNRIYQTVFNQEWITHQLHTLEPEGLALDGQEERRSPWQMVLWWVGVSTLVLALQALGWFQMWELRIFDRWLQWRPMEPTDDRFLIIAVGESDIQYQDQQGYQRTGGALADRALLDALRKIAPHQPRTIGVDFYHEAPYEPELAALLETTVGDRFIAICEKARTVDVQVPTSIAAPPDVSVEQVGFSDFAPDDDYVVRRHLLGMDHNVLCPTPAAFSLRLALEYLSPYAIGLTFDATGQAQLGSKSLKKLTMTSGGYQLSDANVQGYQLLVNYRATHPETISLQQLLSGDLDEQLGTLVGDRIILFGLADGKDSHFIPGQQERIPGVIVQAQMASQLISHVLDQRILLQWLPNYLEWLGVVIVSGTSALLIWWRAPRSFPILLVVSGVSLILLLSYGMLLAGFWVPVIPPTVAWVGTISGLTIRRLSSSKLSSSTQVS